MSFDDPTLQAMARVGLSSERAQLRRHLRALLEDRAAGSPPDPSTSLALHECALRAAGWAAALERSEQEIETYLALAAKGALATFRAGRTSAPRQRAAALLAGLQAALATERQRTVQALAAIPERRWDARSIDPGLRVALRAWQRAAAGERPKPDALLASSAWEIVDGFDPVTRLRLAERAVAAFS